MTPEQNAHVKTLRGKKEIFDYVVTHLKNQKSQSMGSIYFADDDDYDVDLDGYTCAYRGLDNKMCAVGCLIADDEYEPSMEDENVPRLIVLGKLPARLVPHESMLLELQGLHDNPDFFSQSEEKKILHLRRLEAYFFDLST